MKRAFPYPPARDLAIALGEYLMPHCEKLNIAGSIRRGNAAVSDIELICLPALESRSLALFSPPQTGPSEAFIKTVHTIGTPLKGSPNGRYMRLIPYLPLEEGKQLPVWLEKGNTELLVLEGIELDLFIPQPEDYFRQFAIRTGSAEYSRKIANAWVRKGWCGTEQGLRKKATASTGYRQEKPSGSARMKMPSAHPSGPTKNRFSNGSTCRTMKPAMR